MARKQHPVRMKSAKAAKTSAREAELRAELAKAEAEMQAMPRPLAGDPVPQVPLWEAVLAELPHAVTRQTLVAVMVRRYGVSVHTIDRAILKAKEAYAEQAQRTRAELLDEARAFYRNLASQAITGKDYRTAKDVKAEELRLLGITGPTEETAANVPTADQRAEIAARLAAALVRGTEKGGPGDPSSR